MSSPSQRQAANERYMKTLRKLYALLDYDKVHDGVNYSTLAKTIESPAWEMLNLKNTLNEIGILETTVTYNDIVDGKVLNGRRAHWRLTVPLEEAERQLTEWAAKGLSWEYEKRPGYVVKAPFARSKRKASAEPVPEPRNEPTVTIATTEKEETRAIAGPEPEKTFAALASLRKDEPTALVEAARQYANRHLAVEKEYQSLVTMGLVVDKEKFLESISLPRDETLETISLVLPLVTQLQSKNESLLVQLNTAREKLRDYTEVKSNYERLQKRWNERVADKVRNG